MIAKAGRRLDGSWGERAAARHAWWRGARVLARNVRAAGGEVDLVLLHRGVLVFAEVKTRRDREQGLEAVTTTKQRRIARAARAFLVERGLDTGSVPWRFDVLVVVPGRWWPRVTWYKGAFVAS